MTGLFRATGIRPKCAQQLATAGFHMAPGDVRTPARDRLTGAQHDLV